MNLRPAVAAGDAAVGDAMAAAREFAPFALTLVLALSWISVEPFPSLTTDVTEQADKAVNALNLWAYLAVGGLSVACAWQLRPRAFRVLVRPAQLLMLAWLLVSVATSSDPSLSARRLALTLVMIAMAATALALPAGLRQFGRVLAIVALAVLALCYWGCFFIPQVAIHQPWDLPEPQLAGDWRGIFSHKNVAASMMVVFVFTGLLIARVLNRALGWTVIALALVFMLLAGGKTSLALLLPVLLLAPVFLRSRSALLRAAMVFVPVVGLNLVTVGSVMIPAIGQLNAMVLPDPTFTGRTDIWQFAIDKLQERPITGFGYSAFWQTSATMFGGETALDSDDPKGENIATIADHAHNGYLDTALTMGIPGLLLTVLWLIVEPMLDIVRAQRHDASPELMLYFTQVWLFSINFACLESLFFHQTDTVWFTLLIAVLGLTAMARFRITA